jgi:hypothetical protein
MIGCGSRPGMGPPLSIDYHMCPYQPFINRQPNSLAVASLLMRITLLNKGI